jgi:two-component system invasion response regulator UvrY
MIHLFVADDHPIVRAGLKYIVSQCSDIRVVGEAEDGDAVIRALNSDVGSTVDVLLLDVAMPGPGILELIPQVRALRSRLRVLVLSVHSEQQYARRVLKAGADGYLTKDYSSQALAAAIRQVYNGRKYISPSLAEELAIHTIENEGRQPHEMLSNREFQVLLQLGGGRSASAISEALKLSPKTVRTYRTRILEKLELKTTAELIYYVVRHGLVNDVDVSGGAASASADPRTERAKPRQRFR